MNFTRKSVSGLVAGALLSTTAIVSLPSEGWAQLPEVVVTSRKREELLQDVPLSITAFSAAELQRKQITSLEDVAAFTAGLTFEDFVSAAIGFPVIRGISQQNVTADNNNVSTFFDGIYIQKNYAIDLGLTNLERVEIVKGPQSALYGRNAFAGAINYVPRKPSMDGLEVSGGATWGSDERRSVDFYLSGPVIEDKLALSISGGKDEFDGTWENNHPLATGDLENVGGFDNQTYSFQALLTPTDGLEIEAGYYNTERTEEAQNAFQIGGGDTTTSLPCTSTTLVATALICGEISSDPLTYASDTSTRLPGVLVDPRVIPFESDAEITTARVSWDVTDSVNLTYQFGLVETSALVANTEGNYDPLDPVTFGPINLFQKGPGGEAETTSHEARVEFDNGGKVRGLVGYYNSSFEEDVLFDLLFGLPPFITDLLDLPLDTIEFGSPLGNSPDSLFILEQYRSESDVDAVFATLGFDFNDAWSLELEGRYTWETKKTTILDDPTDIRVFEEDFNYFTPRVTLNWDISDDSLVYLSAAKGVNTGGFNRSSSILPENEGSERTYDNEENWTYELGTKNTFLDGRATLSANVFYMQISDFLTRLLPEGGIPGLSATIFQNLGDVTSYGVELQGAIQFNDNFSANGAFSHAVPEFDDGTVSAAFLGICDDVLCPADGDIGGNTLQRSSKTQASLGLTWEDDLPNTDLGYYAQADVTYQSKQYLEEMNLGYVPERTLLNASIGLTHENWDLQLWAKNLTDEEYVANSFFTLQFGSATYSPALGDQRTFGVTGRFNF